MPLPVLAIPAVGAGAGFLARQFVKYAWGPLLVGLGHLFKTRIGLFIATAAIWLGINFSTIKLVIEPAIDALQAYSSSGAVGTGQFAGAAIAYLGILNFDKALTMLISAVVTKHAVMQGRLFLFKRGV